MDNCVFTNEIDYYLFLYGIITPEAQKSNDNLRTPNQKVLRKPNLRNIYPSKTKLKQLSEHDKSTIYGNDLMYKTRMCSLMLQVKLMYSLKIISY